MNVFVSRFVAQKGAVAALAVIVLVILAGLCAPILPLPDPAEVNLAQKLQGFSGEHLLGTDNLGRDVFARLVWGIRTTVFVAIGAMLATTMIGAVYGAVAAVSGKRTDNIMMRVCDTLMSFPSEVTILAMVGLLGPGLENTVIACVAAKWAWYARMMRSMSRAQSGCDYIAFARICGAGTGHILKRHILTRVTGEFSVLMTLDIASTILMISALSFLGLGVQPPLSEWGMMLAETKDLLFVAPEKMLPPGIAIITVACAFNMLGDAIRDALDIKKPIGGERRAS